MALTRPTPAPGNWTYDDLFGLPDDGKRYEIIDGVLSEMPGANLDHQTVLRNLVALLLPVFVALRLEWFFAPLAVFFPGADPVQPDILAFAPGGRTRGRTRGIEGPPDLVVEVLSPSNRRHDLLTKRALYARAGVREDWIVDPEARSIEILVLDCGTYRAADRYAGDARVASPLLPGASFPAAAAFLGLADEA